MVVLNFTATVYLLSCLLRCFTQRTRKRKPSPALQLLKEEVLVTKEATRKR